MSMHVKDIHHKTFFPPEVEIRMSSQAGREQEFNKYGSEAGTVRFPDRQIENRERNQSVNMQAQQCISDLTKTRQKAKLNQSTKDRGEKEGQLQQNPFQPVIISPLTCHGQIDVLRVD